VLEANLGYAAGRLAQGYYIALLIEPLRPDDFEFDGTTLRSGGRIGAPADNDADDRLRPRVSDEITRKRGSKGYADLQKSNLGMVRIKGASRLAKVLPVTPHDNTLPPNLQYPMGAGGLQWKIVPPGKKFLIALYVGSNGMADAGTFKVSLADGDPYQQLMDARQKVARYLETA
jgi:hypothetical protein